jgi:O-antigen/teichoic acid export membrane protein
MPSQDTKPSQTSERKDVAIKTLAKGSGIVLLTLTISKLVTYIYTLIIARASPQLLGEFSIGSSLLALTAISEIGIPAAMYRLVPEYAYLKDNSKLSALLSLALKVGIACGLCAFAIIFFLSDWIAARYFPGYASLGLVFKFFAAAMFLLTLEDILAAIIHGFKRVEIEALCRNIIENTLRVAAVAIAVYAGWGIAQLSLAYAVAELVTVIVSVYLLEKYVFRLWGMNSTPEDNKLVYGKMFFFAVPVMLSQGFSVILNSADTLLMGHYTNPVATGIYAAATTTVLLMLLGPGIITNLDQQVLVEAKQAKDMQLMKTVYRSVTKWIFYFNFPLLLFVLLFSRQVMVVLYGAQYASGAIALAILSIGYFIYTVNTPTFDMLPAIDRPRTFLVVNILIAIFAVVTGFMFIPTYASVGAAATAAASIALVGLLLQADVIMHTGVQPFPRGCLKSVAAALLSMGLTYVVAKHYFLHFPLWALAVISLAYAALYLVLLFLLKAFDPTDISLLKMVEKRYGIKQLAWVRNLAKEYYGKQ